MSTVMDCPHCQPDSFALKHPLIETKHFRVVCDVHPLCEGHILIIPRDHYSCVGELPMPLFEEFSLLYRQAHSFLSKTYGQTCAFEHGKIGQTVFHCHVHLLPCRAKLSDIVPEGMKYIETLSSLSSLRSIFAKEGHYLFVAIDGKSYTVDTSLAVPRLFRDRFARALGNAGRGDWKAMKQNRVLMEEGSKEMQRLKVKWGEAKAGK